MLLTALPGHAQPPSTNRSATISHARMRSILQGMGVEFTEKSSGDSTAFAFPLNGHIVTVLNQVKSMQLSACVQDHVDPMKANHWNQDHFPPGSAETRMAASSLYLIWASLVELPTK